MRIRGACCLVGDVASAACARGGALRRPRACRRFLSLLVACFFLTRGNYAEKRGADGNSGGMSRGTFCCLLLVFNGVAWLPCHFLCPGGARKNNTSR